MQPRTEFHYVEHEAAGVINRVQDCQSILDHTAELRAVGATGAGGDMHHVANFPVVLVEKYCNDRGITFADWLRDPAHPRAMLQDPSLSGFRVHEGRV